MVYSEFEVVKNMARNGNHRNIVPFSSIILTCHFICFDYLVPPHRQKMPKQAQFPRWKTPHFDKEFSLFLPLSSFDLFKKIVSKKETKRLSFQKEAAFQGENLDLRYRGAFWGTNECVSPVRTWKRAQGLVDCAIRKLRWWNLKII